MRWGEGKYFDLARELKKVWTMKAAVVPIIVGALGTVLKSSAKKLDECEIKRIETTHMTTSARILMSAVVLKRPFVT